MSIKYVFNPFTGTFDAVPDIPAAAQATPTTMQQNLVVPDHTQMLARRKIVVDNGLKILVGNDAGVFQI